MKDDKFQLVFKHVLAISYIVVETLNWFLFNIFFFALFRSIPSIHKCAQNLIIVTLYKLFSIFFGGVSFLPWGPKMFFWANMKKIQVGHIFSIFFILVGVFNRQNMKKE